MGSLLRYSCRQCGFQAEVGGPDEFFVGADGGRHRYGHPDPVSAEAAARGVDGFWMDLWCDGCASVKRIVTMEFEDPCEPLDAWAGRGLPRPGFLVDGEHCPDCGSTLNDEIPGPRPDCPACHRGQLTGEVLRK